MHTLPFSFQKDCLIWDMYIISIAIQTLKLITRFYLHQHLFFLRFKKKKRGKFYAWHITGICSFCILKHNKQEIQKMLKTKNPQHHLLTSHEYDDFLLKAQNFLKHFVNTGKPSLLKVCFICSEDERRISSIYSSMFICCLCTSFE